MIHPRPHAMKPTDRTVPVLLAMLALVVQMIVTALPHGAAPVATAEAAAFTAMMGGTICPADGAPASDPAQPSQGHHGHDCLLCPVCFGLAATPPGRIDSPVAPIRAIQVRYLLPAAGAGPPTSPFATAHPRAPPVV